MNTLLISYVIDIRWHLKGIDGYGFGSDKQLYNIKKGTVIKKCLNTRSIGYWINHKFYSENKLKPLLIRPVNFDCPF